MKTKKYQKFYSKQIICLQTYISQKKFFNKSMLEL